MKIVVAPDSFKEALSAAGVAGAIAEGIRQVVPNAEIVQLPIADGGEGTTDALIAATGGQRYEREVTGPVGLPVTASFGILGDGNTAVVECAAASGLERLPPSLRNPWSATTFGTGELLQAALREGVQRVIVGLGGSATNDAGIGMLTALGAAFYSADDRLCWRGAEDVAAIARMDLSKLDPRLQQVQIDVACDVSNPFVGDSGASAVFGPQKGADADMVKRMDKALAGFSDKVKSELGVDLQRLPGSGAAGGLGGAFHAFLGGELRSGISIVLEAVKLSEHLKGCDLVITGEGRIDHQTVFGKAPAGVAAMAREAGVPIVALGGAVTADAQCSGVFDAVFSIMQGPASLDEALPQTALNLRQTAENIVRMGMALKG